MRPIWAIVPKVGQSARELGKKYSIINISKTSLAANSYPPNSLLATAAISQGRILSPAPSYTFSPKLQQQSFWAFLMAIQIYPGYLGLGARQIIAVWKMRVGKFSEWATAYSVTLSIFDNSKKTMPKPFEAQLLLD